MYKRREQNDDVSEESPGEGSMIREELNDEELFLAVAFQAAIEDDPEVDAIRRSTSNELETFFVKKAKKE